HGDRRTRWRALLRGAHLAAPTDPSRPHARLSNQPVRTERLLPQQPRSPASVIVSGEIDVLVVSCDSTLGWTAAAGELADAFAKAGARVEWVSTGPVPDVRTLMYTDYVQARAAARVAAEAIPRCRPRAVVYCSIISSLRWPRPGAIWLDALTAENRPGRHGIWQRWVERRRLEQASLVMTMSEHSLDPLP